MEFAWKIASEAARAPSDIRAIIAGCALATLLENGSSRGSLPFHLSNHLSATYELRKSLVLKTLMPSHRVLLLRDWQDFTLRPDSGLE
jgi:hypothetical protein